MSMGELALNNNVKPKKEERKAFWENVIRLYKVNWQLRKGFVIYAAIAGLVVSFLKFIFYIFIKAKEELVYFVDSFPSCGGVVVLATIFVVVGTEYTIFNSDETSMLPGNVASRVLSRIMCDLSIIMQAAICDAVIHLMCLGMGFLLKNLGVGYIADIMFDWNRFLCKLVYCIALCVAVYMVFAIVYGLLVRFGIVRVLIVTGVLVVIGIISMVIIVTGDISENADSILSGTIGTLSEAGAYKNIFWVLSAIIVMSVLVWLIVKSIHEWKKEDKKYIIVGVLLAYNVIIPIALLLYCFPLDTDMYDKAENTLEQDIKAGKVLYKDDIISVGEVSADKLNESYATTKQIGGGTLEEMEMSIGFCEYEDAKRAGLIPADTILADGQMYIRTIASNEKYKDKYIYQNFIDGIKLTIENGEYNLSYDRDRVFLDNYMGIFDKIVMGKDKLYFSFGLSHYSTTYIVYRAGDLKDEEEISNIGGFLTWYLSWEEE